MSTAGIDNSFQLLTPEELEALPDLIWLIDGVLPRPCLAVLYGDPGCGKTFVALSMALAAASGRDWIGHRCQCADVLFIAAEGVHGIKNRLAADRVVNGLTSARIRFLAGAPNMLDPKDVKKLGATLEKANFRPGLIVVDTLARVTTGADENNARDMGVAVEALDALKTAYDAAVLIIHHKTKSGGSERGSSALRGAADVMIECRQVETGSGIGVTLECTKMKDDEPFKDMAISLERVGLPGGRSSLVLGAKIGQSSLAGTVSVEQILGLLNGQFAEDGATNKQLLNAFQEANYGSKSTFDRAIREAKKAGKVRVDGERQGKKYFPAIKSKADPEAANG